MNKVFIIIGVGIFIAAIVFASTNNLNNFSSPTGENATADEVVKKVFQNPLEIEAMRARQYPGSDIVIEKELAKGINYKRYIASYKSDNLKIFGLLTIPDGPVPRGPEGVVGWPAIIFNHGYISPSVYKTTEKYVAYLDGFARNKYVVFKVDYRGHGDSEGRATGNYFSPGYAVDVLNAVSSIKKLKDPSAGSGQVVNPDKIGMWGHSMGGNITMRNLVINNDIKAAVIWAGVVGSYGDILNNWNRAGRWRQSPEHKHQGPSRQNFIDDFGTYTQNIEFWNSIDPHAFIADINTPIQIHHGTGDTHVPISFSESFKKVLEKNDKQVEFYSYKGADHNLSGSAFGPAMQRSIEFFDKYLK